MLKYARLFSSGNSYRKPIPSSNTLKRIFILRPVSFWLRVTSISLYWFRIRDSSPQTGVQYSSWESLSTVPIVNPDTRSGFSPRSSKPRREGATTVSPPYERLYIGVPFSTENTNSNLPSGLFWVSPSMEATLEEALSQDTATAKAAEANNIFFMLIFILDRRYVLLSVCIPPPGMSLRGQRRHFRG